MTKNFAGEPFRLFFPAATLAGIVGVALWPLHLTNIAGGYPGQAHAQLMTNSFFGGFIIGFLGTAMPRMLSAKPLRMFETLALLAVYVAMTAVCAAGKLQMANALFLCLLGGLVAIMIPRALQRKDMPPPGFILVALSLACAAAGAALALTAGEEPAMARVALQRLLSEQGFILLPILGIGPFILPRFFGLGSSHDLPESIRPSADWSKKAGLALVSAIAIVISFLIEAKGNVQLAYAIRFVATAGYLFMEMPLRSGPGGTNIFGAAIRIALLGIVLGFLFVALFPAYKVALLHVTFVGGFALITFVVATRVLFGHSGNIALLKKRNRWFLISMGLMLFAMTTRISGDFWPKIMASHYIYGAVVWIGAVLIWAFYTLPKALVAESE